MSEPGREEQARAGEIARDALESIVAADASLAHSARAHEPLLVRSPSGEPAGWLIGVVVEERLVGFVQLDRELRFHRYASFQRRPGSLDGCPPAADWLDPETVVRRARQNAGPSAKLGVPLLTYDGNPDRVVWAVQVTGGRPRTIHVAGDYVY